MENDLPFVAFGNDELSGKRDVGEYEKCNNCGNLHEVQYGDKVNPDGTKTKSKLLAFIKCPENDALYLVGVGGKCVGKDD